LPSRTVICCEIQKGTLKKASLFSCGLSSPALSVKSGHSDPTSGENMSDSLPLPKQPRLSLITVCWNAEATIADTLKSIDSQTYRDFEHIIVDGASTDATLSIIHSLPAENRHLHSAADKGIYDAMNKGIGLARGEIIGCLNADDVFASDSALEKIAGAFDARGTDCVFGDLVYVSRDQPDQVVRYWKSSDFKPNSFRYGWFPPHPTLYVKRAIYDRLGRFDLGYRHAADVELMMRFFEIGRISSARIPQVLVRMKTGGASNNGLKTVLRQNREILDALAKHGLPVSPVSYWASKLYNRFVQFIAGKVRKVAGD
jgi:glycosyltransferase involved in cell wall biosynthesis